MTRSSRRQHTPLSRTSIGSGIGLTRKRLLNIHHLPRTRLHEPIPPALRPLQPIPRADLAHPLQIAFVPRHDTHGQHAVLLEPCLALNLNHLVEVLERLQGVRLRDVVDEQEGVGAEVAGGPESAVFFLARRVGEGEGVGDAVDGARDGVGVFDRGVVSAQVMSGLWVFVKLDVRGRTRESIGCVLSAA